MNYFQARIGTIVAVMAATAMTGMLQAQTLFSNALVAYYSLNGNANDYFGINNGTATGVTTTTNQFGVTNAAYHFNGTSSAIILPYSALNNLGQGTMAVWAKLDNNTEETLFAKQHSGVNSESIWLVGVSDSYGAGTDSEIAQQTPGEICFRAQNSSPQAYSTVNLTTNTWYFLTVTFSSTNCNLFVNGNYAGSATGDFSLPDDSDPSEMAIGYWSEVNVGFQGSMDNYMIFNTALSSNQVAQLYAAESSAPIQITQNLTNTVVLSGSNVVLSLVATNSSTLTYQWYFNPANGAGQAGGYALSAGNFIYDVVITNGGFGYGNIPNVSFVGGGGSGAAGNATVTNGVVTGVAMTSAGTGYTSLPAVVIDAPNGLFYGQTNSTLTITNANSNNVGSYFVVVSNGSLSLTSSVVNLTVVSPPSITANPIGFAANLHGSGSLSVSAAGTAPLSYQWVLNGTNLTSATNSFFIINSLVLTNAGAYSVRVANPYGYVTSSIANVELVPSLTSPFTGAVGVWGQATILDVGAVGSGTLSYQWYFDGAAIAGATSSTYDLSSLQFTNAGLYSVVVSSAYGSVTNTAYQVVVNAANVALGTCPMVYLNGTVGYTYAIQSSTNLANTNAWVTLTNITLTSASMIWADTATDTRLPANPLKFYRVLAGQ